MENLIPHKTFRYLLVFLFVFTSQALLYSQVPEKAMLNYPEADKNMSTVKNAMKAYEAGNWELLRNSVTDDAVFYNLGSFDSLNISETINYWKKGRETAIPSLADDQIWLPVAVSEGPRQGQWVLHWGSNTLGYPNGDTITFPYHIATHMKEGKISKIYFYYDNNRIIRAMGYSIDPPLKEDEGLEDFKP